MQPLGVTAGSLQALGAPQALRTARLAEDLGYGSFWVAGVESQGVV